MQELPGHAAHFPDTLIRTAPIVPQPLQQTLNLQPSLVRHRLTVFIGEVDGLHHLSVNIELQLLVSSVADANWPRILVTAKMIQRDFLEIPSAVHAVHDLQRTSLGIIAEATLDPLYERIRFVDEAQPDERI